MPYPASITPRWIFIPIDRIAFGISFHLPFGLTLAKGRGRGGTPFYYFSGGSFLMSIGRTLESSRPLLQSGQVRYSWFERSQ
jgi:hypothetical protein